MSPWRSARWGGWFSRWRRRSVGVMFAWATVLILVELVGSGAGGAEGRRRHALAPPPHRRALRAARHHHPRGGPARHDRRLLAVIGPEGPGLVDGLVLLGVSRGRPDLRHVVDLLRGAVRRPCSMPIGSARGAGATATSRSSPRPSRSVPGLHVAAYYIAHGPHLLRHGDARDVAVPLALYCLTSSCCTCRSPGASTRFTSSCSPSRWRSRSRALFLAVAGVRPVLVPGRAGRVALGDRGRLRDHRAPAQPASARLARRELSRTSASSGRGRASRPTPARRRRARTSARSRYVGSGRGDLGQHPLALVADPVAAPVGDQPGHQVVEAAPVRLARGRRSPRCGTPRPGRARRPRPTSPGSSSSRSPRDERGRVGAGDLDRGQQPLPPVVLLGPDQVGQPRHRVGVGDVERVQVDAAAPGDLGGVTASAKSPRSPSHSSSGPAPAGHGCRLRCRPRVATTGPGRGTARRSRRPRAAPAARARARPERRDQGRQSPDLVGLRGAGQDRGPDRAVVAEQRVAAARRTARARARRASGPRRRPGSAAA